jgi:hypothetical protein
MDFLLVVAIAYVFAKGPAKAWKDANAVLDKVIPKREPESTNKLPTDAGGDAGSDSDAADPKASKGTSEGKAKPKGPKAKGTRNKPDPTGIAPDVLKDVAPLAVKFGTRAAKARARAAVNRLAWFEALSTAFEDAYPEAVEGAKKRIEDRAARRRQRREDADGGSGSAPATKPAPAGPKPAPGAPKAAAAGPKSAATATTPPPAASGGAPKGPPKSPGKTAAAPPAAVPPALPAGPAGPAPSTGAGARTQPAPATTAGSGPGVTPAPVPGAPALAIAATVSGTADSAGSAPSSGTASPPAPAVDRPLTPAKPPAAPPPAPRPVDRGPAPDKRQVADGVVIIGAKKPEPAVPVVAAKPPAAPLPAQAGSSDRPAAAAGPVGTALQEGPGRHLRAVPQPTQPGADGAGLPIGDPMSLAVPEVRTLQGLLRALVITNLVATARSEEGYALAADDAALSARLDLIEQQMDELEVDARTRQEILDLKELVHSQSQEATKYAQAAAATAEVAQATANNAHLYHGEMGEAVRSSPIKSAAQRNYYGQA